MLVQFQCQNVLFQAIQFSISIIFVYTQLNVKTVLFQSIQFSVSTVSMSKQFYFKQLSLVWVQFHIQKQFNFKQFSLAYKNNSISSNWVYHKTVLFQAVQCSISRQFSSIWSIDRTPSSADTPGQSVPGSDDSEEVLRIPQSSSITGASPSDCLVSYQETRYVVGTLPSQLDKVFFLNAYLRVHSEIALKIKHIYHIYQPLCAGRIWHKFNF